MGSTQSREGNERLEEKVDAILRTLSPEQAEKIIAEIEDRFDRGQPSA